jgi:hypothetical protein
MTEDDVRQLFRDQAEAMTPDRRNGGMRAWCRHHGISQAYASQFLNGHKAPGAKILAALGLRSEISYFPVDCD